MLATVAPLSTLSMGVALARHIAMSGEITVRARFLLGGFILGVGPGVVVAFVGATASAPLSFLLFNRTGYSSVFAATLFMLAGYSFYTVLYAFYRGSGQMGKANLWQLAVVALGPVFIAAAYAQTGKLERILYLMGALYFAAGLPIARYLLKGFPAKGDGLDIRPQLKELFRYALPRVPAGFALAGIMSTGPFLAPYFGSVKDAGYLVVGQSLFILADTGFSAFGLIVLPKVVQLVSEGRRTLLSHRISDMIALAIHLGSYASLHLVLWSHQLILVWLGRDYLDAIPAIGILAVALVPYLIYVLLRSVIDGAEIRAVNTYNLYVALIVTVSFSLVLGFMGFGVLALAVGTTLGFFTLGLATVRYFWRTRWVSREGLSHMRLKECLWLNAGVLGIGYGIKSMISAVAAPAAGLGLALVLEIVTFSLYVLILRQLKVDWIFQVEERVVRACMP
jgi:O-antigen/teichoic acid export membrane protein